jgi:hypothetical protein
MDDNPVAPLSALGLPPVDIGVGQLGESEQAGPNKAQFLH